MILLIVDFFKVDLLRLATDSLYLDCVLSTVCMWI